MELLIVIVILSVLAAIVVFAVGTTASNAVTASCSSDATTIETALSNYEAAMGALSRRPEWADHGDRRCERQHGRPVAAFAPRHGPLRLLQRQRRKRSTS